MKKLNNNKKVSNLENLLFIRLEEYTRKGWKGNGLLNIYDDMINVKYTVKGNFLSLKHCLHIYNIKGKEISTVQKKVSFFNDIYILKIENKKVGILKKKFNILRPTMILNNGWKVEGKILGSGLSIKSNDKIIAKITSSKIDDSTYQIELDKNENELLILMIIVVTYIDNAISERILEKNINSWVEKKHLQRRRNEERKKEPLSEEIKEKLMNRSNKKY